MTRTRPVALAPSLGAQRLQIDALRPFHGNPRRGNVDVIAESLRRNGQYRPIVVNAGTITGRPNEVLAGNHTLGAASLLSWDVLDCWVIDVDDDTARRIVLVDNRSNDLADYDDQALVDLLAELAGDLEGTGYDTADLDQLLAGLDEDPIGGEPDDVPDVDPTPVSQPGDVWTCGPHRLIVGDATDPGPLLEVLDGAPVDCVWTDPPYGVDYVGKTADALTIQGDDGDGLVALLAGAFATVRAVARPGCPVYVACPPGPAIAVFLDAFRAAFSHRQNLVWVKNTIVLGRSDFHYQHEAILAGDVGPVAHPVEVLAGDVDDPDVDPDAVDDDGKDHQSLLYGFTGVGKQKLGRLGRGGRRWFGGNNQSTVFEVPKPTASAVHPTMKPVELIERMIRPSCRPGGLVLDLFGGSGSTMVAAHRTGRRAVLVELDPLYADVICRRWATFSGTPAVRHDGEEFPS